MIAVLAGGYLAIGAVVAALGMRRGARALELLALLVTWPLYAPLWLERLPPARDRATVLATALDRVGAVGDTVVTAADAPLWLERLARATAELAALEQPSRSTAPAWSATVRCWSGPRPSTSADAPRRPQSTACSTSSRPRSRWRRGWATAAPSCPGCWPRWRRSSRSSTPGAE